ncbi:MAG: pyruvate kinase [Verrucomicrobia bacterium]|nr:pyruvate kinase [Verrucomicrobiota bacterium]
MRKTKIICTLGPASDSDVVIGDLILAGTNIFRLNMSHARHDWVRDVVKRIRRIAAGLHANCGILLDTQGPAIRTGDLSAKLNLKPGDIFEFTVRGAKSEEQFSVDVNYDGLVDDIHVGDVVLVDNGVIHMKVLEKNANRVKCQLLTEGDLGSRRHINLPGVKVNLPPLTAKDLEDIELGVEVGVDFVALSFCREASDILELKRVLRSLGSNARTVAKIEDQNAVRYIKDIVRAADSIMVARGDLGIECKMEELPIIQRRIIKECIQFGRPVIVATHMLESMITNPIPTRAEITDVANAVFEQADAVMLSGETAQGKYPVDCVKVLDRVARRIALSGGAGYANDAILATQRQKTIRSAVMLANSIEDSKLVVFTRTGEMADQTSHLRPERAPIFVFTPTQEEVRHQTLNWNSHAFQLDFTTDAEETFAEAEKFLIQQKLVASGEKLIVLRELIEGEERFESIQIRTVP